MQTDQGAREYGNRTNVGCVDDRVRNERFERGK